MVPFKERINGMIKNTAVLLILLYVSESYCTIVLHRNSGNFLSGFPNQASSSKGESQSSADLAAYLSKREILKISPSIRDVRADSRQSRIDARDIRTDFQEIRTELNHASRLPIHRRDSLIRSHRMDLYRGEETGHRRTIRETKYFQENKNDFDQQQQRRGNFRSNLLNRAKSFQVGNMNDRRSRIILNDRRDILERNFRENILERSVFDRHLKSSAKSSPIRRESIDRRSRSAYRNIRKNNQEQVLREIRDAIQFHREPVADVLNAGHYDHEKRYFSAERTNAIRKNDRRQGRHYSHRERRNIQIGESRNKLITGQIKSDGRFSKGEPERQEQSVSRIRFQPQRNDIRLIREESRREFSESLQNTENTRQDRRKYDSRDYTGHGRFNNALPNEYIGNSHDGPERVPVERSTLLFTDARRSSKRLYGRHLPYDQQPENTSRKNFELLTRNNRDGLSRNIKNTQRDLLRQVSWNRLDNEGIERSRLQGDTNLSERGNNVRLTEQSRLNNRYIRSPDRLERETMTVRKNQLERDVSSADHNRKAKTSCSGPEHRETYRFKEIDTSRKISSQTRDVCLKRNINNNEINEKRVDSDNIEYRREFYPKKFERSDANNRQANNNYQYREILQAISEKGRYNDLFSLSSTRNPIMVTSDFKFIPNVVIRTMQTLLIIALAGQILQKASKSKLTLTNWRSVFGKEKVF